MADTKTDVLLADIEAKEQDLSPQDALKNKINADVIKIN